MEAAGSRARSAGSQGGTYRAGLPFIALPVVWHARPTDGAVEIEATNRTLPLLLMAQAFEPTISHHHTITRRNPIGDLGEMRAIAGHAIARLALNYLKQLVRAAE